MAASNKLHSKCLNIGSGEHQKDEKIDDHQNSILNWNYWRQPSWFDHEIYGPKLFKRPNEQLPRRKFINKLNRS